MTMEQLQTISVLTDLIHRTDIAEIQSKFIKLLNQQLDEVLLPELAKEE